MKIPATLAFAALAGGCVLHRASSLPEPARAPARDTLFRVDEARTDSVAARGALAGMLASLDENVIYLHAGWPVAAGLSATKRFLAATHDTSQPSWQPLGGGVSNDLRAGYTFGVTVRGNGVSPARFERYVAFWTRAAGGPWRIVAYSEVNAPAQAPRERARDTAADGHLGTAAPPPSPAVAEAEQRVRAADSLFSDLLYRMGTSYAFASTAAPDGVLLGEPRIVVGPREIQEYLDETAGQSSLSRQPLYAWVASSRDLGFTVGEYTITARGQSGAAVQRFGKYLTVWRRQSDGTWKFVVDGPNPSPPRGDER